MAFDGFQFRWHVFFLCEDYSFQIYSNVAPSLTSQ